MLELRHLRYFVVVTEDLNFSTAAEWPGRVALGRATDLNERVSSPGRKPQISSCFRFLRQPRGVRDSLLEWTISERAEQDSADTCFRVNRHCRRDSVGSCSGRDAGVRRRAISSRVVLHP
jgi:hypothetical protein